MATKKKPARKRKPKPVLAWHWLAAPGKLANGDARKVVVGETLTHKGALELCRSGLHASERALDSLQYAPGNILCRVECSGKILRDETKLVCTERKVLWMVDAEETLRAFARRCASDVLHFWAAPEIVKEYLRTGDEPKRDAARDAAWAAAEAAAWAAAWAAARDAAWAAAWAAARAAAWAAARDAAEDAARDRYNSWLEEMLLALEPKPKARKPRPSGGKEK